MAQLEAGSSAVNITPPVGVDLSGFGGRVSGCVGVHDELFAEALVLRAGDVRLGLVTSDLIGLDADTVADVRDRVAARIDLPPERLMISCSHTHSGPATPCLPFLGGVDESYVEVLKGKLASVVGAAAGELQPASLAAGREEVLVGVNRRQRLPDGRIVLGINPQGNVAPYVDVLRLQGEAETPRAVFFSHAAHPVTLGGDNLLVTADFPGFARQIVERAWSPAPVAMFGQGCCGNINSDRDRPGDFPQARRLGYRLGAAAVKAAEKMWTELGDDVALAAASDTVELPLFDPPPLAEAEATLQSLQTEREAAYQQDNLGRRELADGLVGWAERVLELSRQDARGLTVPIEIQALRIGDVAVVGLPGEVFVEYQLNIDAASPFRQTIVLAYTNGNIGYFPTASAYPEGGYEVEAAYKYYGTLMHRPESEGQVLASARQLLDGLVRSGEPL